MKTFLLSVLLAAASFAGESQVGPIHILYGNSQNYGIPGLPEPPYRVDWYQVIIRTETPGIVAFRVTLRYKQQGEEIRTATLAAPVLEGHRYAWLTFPRPPAPVVGIVVEELRAEPAIEIIP